MAQDFLAVAQIEIAANTKLFTTQLNALLAETRAIRPIEIPIRAQIGTTAAKLNADVAAASASAAAGQTEFATSTNVATESLVAEGDAATLAASDIQRLNASHAEALAINRALAQTEKAVALAKLEVVGAATAEEAAEIKLGRQTAAGVAARELLTTAELHGVDAQVLLQNALVKTAIAEGEVAAGARAQAAADEQAAVAAGHRAVQQRNVARGAVTTALATVGLRGATLTANAGFIAGAASAIAFGKAIQTAAKFETSLNVFAATAGATAEQMQQVSEQAQALGRDISLPGVSANQAADAMSELAKAGLSVEDSIAGARGVLQLATAAAIDNASAVQIAASALNAFGLSGDQAVHVADVLANAANLAQGSIEDVGISLAQAAAVARQVGISFEDAVALLTELARNGIRGSDAGTSLRVSLIRLINPTAKAAAVLKDLNVQVRDQAGNVRPEVFADFAKAQSNLTKAQQDANAAIVFGTDGLRTYAIAAREGLAGLDSVRAGLEKQGTAAELAGARTQGLAGSAENLKNQLGTLALSIGQGLSPTVKDFVDFLSEGIANINTGLDALAKLTGQTDEATKSFHDLAVEAGNANAAVARRISGETSKVNKKPSQELLAIQLKTTKALEDALGPGIAATNMIEGYGAANAAAALQAEGLRNRIDETTDRFAKQAATATPRGPVAIGPTAKLDRAIGLAQADNDLQEVARLQQTALDRARKALADSHGNIKQRTALFNDVTQAEVALATTKQQIADDAAQKAQQADEERKRRAKAAQDARDKADQAVLDAFAPKQARLDVRGVQVAQTATLKDDLALQVAIAKQASLEISIIDKTVKDQQTRKAQIAERVLLLAKTGSEITSLVKQIGKNAKDRAAAALQATTDILAANLQLAQLQLGPKGQGKDAVLAAFDAVIKNARKRVAAAKKGSLAQKQEQIALQQFVNDRRDFLEGLKKDVEKGQGTTAFDLLKQFADTFNQNAGNLINPAQPFAGPTGFTADISQFLIRRENARVAQPGARPGDDVVSRAIAQNTEALKENTAAITGRKNASTSDGTVVRAGSGWATRRWFGAAHTANRFQDD